jgi:hypothetical protein
MPKTLQEVQALYDELRDCYAQAHADPQVTGRRLKQQIIQRATDLCASIGEFGLSPPAGLDGADLGRHNADVRRIKADAEEIRHWALHLPTG